MKETEEKVYVPSGKTYEIKTIDQLVNVATPENVDELAKDLYVWLCTVTGLFAKLKKDHPSLAKKTNSQIAKNTFVWIDDGKDNMSFRGVSTETGEVTEFNSDQPTK